MEERLVGRVSRVRFANFLLGKNQKVKIYESVVLVLQRHTEESFLCRILQSDDPSYKESRRSKKICGERILESGLLDPLMEIAYLYQYHNHES